MSKRKELIRALPKQIRTCPMEVTARAEDGKPTIYQLSLSSEFPVQRYFGLEVLEHSREAVDLTRTDSLPLLDSHDRYAQIGVVENVSLGSDRKLRGEMRFSRSVKAQEIEQDVIDKIRVNVSIGYRINEVEVTNPETENPTYRVTAWELLEASLLSVPADPTVGVGRSAENEELYPVRIKTRSLESKAMEPKIETNGTPVVADIPAPAPVTGTPTVDRSKMAGDIVRTLRRFGMDDRAADCLEKGMTIDQVRELIIEARGAEVVKTPAPESKELLTEKEAKQYSYSRAILAAADQREGMSGASFELDVSQTLARTMPAQYKPQGGFLVPMSLRKTDPVENKRASAETLKSIAGILEGSRVIDSVTANAIKEAVFTVYGGELIEMLRNTAVVAAMGARVLSGLTSPVGFVRQTGDMVAHWVQENPGADVAESDVGTDIVYVTPKTLQATGGYTRQLLTQSSIDVEAMVRMSIVVAHALALDLAALHGSGTGNEPRGIYAQPGVLTEDFSTATPANKLNYSSLVNMQEKVASANALLGSLGWVTTPSVASAGKKTLQFAVNGSSKIWDGKITDGEMDGYVARITNQVKKNLGTGTNEHGLIFGNWADLIIAQFGGAMEIIADPYSKKKRGIIEVTSFHMCDVVPRHPQSFCVGTKLIPN